MKDNIVFFSEARASDKGNAKFWSVLDALKNCIRDIESGECKPDMVFIALREDVPDSPGEVQYPYYTAGVDTMEAHGLLTIHLKRL